MSWVFLWGEKMSLPTAAELTDPNATNTQMKQRLGRLAENVISKNEVNEKIVREGQTTKNRTMISIKDLKGSSEVDENAAFVVDAQGKILFGYDLLNDKPIIANSSSLINKQKLSSEILSADAIRNLKKNEPAANAAFVVDSAGNILFGYDTVNDKPIIANLDLAVANPIHSKKLAFEKKLLVKAINHMLFYGQSLTLGATATTILSTTQPYNNKTFNTGPRMDSTASSVIPLVEQFNNPSNDGQSNRGETPCSGAANYATKLSREQNSQEHVIFASAAGHGGYSISELEKGTNWYNTFLLNQVTKAAELNGADFKTQVVNWAQGEADITDGTSYATYLAKLNQLQIDMNADIKAITGQTDNIPFITYQCSYGTALHKDIALAQLKISQENPMVFLSTPTYRFPYGSDKTHLTNVGYKLMGAYFGRAYKQLVIDNQVPDFINPLGAKIIGNTIEVTFDVPKLPLRLDTTNLASTTNFGFKVIDSNDSNVSINSVTVDKNKVFITLASAPSNDLKVRYALDYLGTGLNILNGASGNLRDSTTDSVVINSTTHTLFHVCPHFELTAYLEKGI